jgi:hypothetical protein
MPVYASAFHRRGVAPSRPRRRLHGGTRRGRRRSARPSMGTGSGRHHLGGRISARHGNRLGAPTSARSASGRGPGPASFASLARSGWKPEFFGPGLSCAMTDLAPLAALSETERNVRHDLSRGVTRRSRQRRTVVRCGRILRRQRAEGQGCAELEGAPRGGIAAYSPKCASLSEKTARENANTSPFRPAASDPMVVDWGPAALCASVLWRSLGPLHRGLPAPRRRRDRSRCQAVPAGGCFQNAVPTGGDAARALPA